MDRKYRTSHQGIASYLKMQGIEVLRTERGRNSKGRDVVYVEFDIDSQAGRELGDAFFDGLATGNLREFHQAEYDIRQLVRQQQNR